MFLGSKAHLLDTKGYNTMNKMHVTRAKFDHWYCTMRLKTRALGWLGWNQILTTPTSWDKLGHQDKKGATQPECGIVFNSVCPQMLSPPGGIFFSTEVVMSVTLLPVKIIMLPLLVSRL